MQLVIAVDTRHAMSRRHMIALLVVACGVLAGCGGATSKAPRYVAAANAICSAELRQLRALGQPSTPDQAISYLPKALTIISSETRRLATLNPPASNRPELTSALASERQLAAVLGRFLHALRSGTVELSTFSQVQTQSATLKSSLDAHFRQAGLALCTQ
jgi:hypothetical protein